MGATTLSSPPSHAQPEEATPLHILQLRNQLQRIKARKLQFMEETKVFQTSLTNFLCFQYPEAAAFFTAQPTMAHPVNLFAATQPKSTTKPSDEAGNTEQVHFSSDDENDIFDWHTLMEHHIEPRSTDIPESAHAQKHKAPAPVEGEALLVEHPPPEVPATNTEPARRRGKALVGRIITRDPTSSPDVEEQLPPRPAKRQRRYNIITTDNDNEGIEELPATTTQAADTLLSHTF
ncbi:hypothetical protein GQ457_06G011130 [Hibiscus cannabinus]